MPKPLSKKLILVTIFLTALVGLIFMVSIEALVGSSVVLMCPPGWHYVTTQTYTVSENKQQVQAIFCYISDEESMEIPQNTFNINGTQAVFLEAVGGQGGYGHCQTDSWSTSPHHAGSGGKGGYAATLINPNNVTAYFYEGMVGANADSSDHGSGGGASSIYSTQMLTTNNDATQTNQTPQEIEPAGKDSDFGILLVAGGGGGGGSANVSGTGDHGGYGGQAIASNSEDSLASGQEGAGKHHPQGGSPTSTTPIGGFGGAPSKHGQPASWYPALDFFVPTSWGYSNADKINNDVTGGGALGAGGGGFAPGDHAPESDPAEGSGGGGAGSFAATSITWNNMSASDMIVGKKLLLNNQTLQDEINSILTSSSFPKHYLSEKCKGHSPYHIYTTDGALFAVLLKKVID